MTIGTGGGGQRRAEAGRGGQRRAEGILDLPIILQGRCATTSLALLLPRLFVCYVLCVVCCVVRDCISRIPPIPFSQRVAENGPYTDAEIPTRRTHQSTESRIHAMWRNPLYLSVPHLLTRHLPFTTHALLTQSPRYIPHRTVCNIFMEDIYR